MDGDDAVGSVVDLVFDGEILDDSILMNDDVRSVVEGESVRRRATQLEDRSFGDSDDIDFDVHHAVETGRG